MVLNWLAGYVLGSNLSSKVIAKYYTRLFMTTT